MGSLCTKGLPTTKRGFESMTEEYFGENTQVQAAKAVLKSIDEPEVIVQDSSTFTGGLPALGDAIKFSKKANQKLVEYDTD